jgi:hypothetical protein
MLTAAKYTRLGWPTKAKVVEKVAVSEYFIITYPSPMTV